MPATNLYRLTSAFFDSKGVLHPRGTELVLTEDEAPRSAKCLGKPPKKPKPKAKPADAPQTLSEAADEEPNIVDVQPGDTLAELTKKMKKKG